MATISLYAGKLNLMPEMIQGVRQSVSDFQTDLSALRTQTLAINRSVCDLTDISNFIQASTLLQDQRVEKLDTFRTKVEEFSEEVVRIDKLVAELINQRKNAFYEQFTHLKPRAEMTWFETVREELVSTGEWHQVWGRLMSHMNGLELM